MLEANKDIMWTAVYIAQEKALADKLREKLDAEGIISMMRPLGGGESCYEIMVPRTEVPAAHTIIFDMAS